MAAISWSIVGLNISEAERAQAIAAGESSDAARAAANAERLRRLNEIVSPDQTNIGFLANPDASPSATPGPAAPYPWGWRKPEEWLRLGYIYLDGHWVLATEPRDVMATPTSPPSTGTLANDIGPGAPKTLAITSGNDFVGGTVDRIRMTTGIGSGTDGALTPIREGDYGLPRIMIGDVYT
jgi:hypothetical protein